MRKINAANNPRIDVPKQLSNLPKRGNTAIYGINIKSMSPIKMPVKVPNMPREVKALGARPTKPE